MKYLSASRIETFRQCPLNFYFRYIEKAKDFDKTVQFYGDYGTMVHEILEKVARKQISPSVALYEFESNYPFCYVPQDQIERYYHQGRKIIQDKAEEISKLDIVGVELDFTEFVEFGIPEIHGFVDLVYRTPKGLVIRDYKTSKPFTSSDQSNKLQPYLYAFAVQRIFKEVPYRFEFDHLLEGEYTSYIIDDMFMEMAYYKVKAAWNEIKSSQYSARYQPFYCDTFCGYRSLCAEYQKKLKS